MPASAAARLTSAACEAGASTSTSLLAHRDRPTPECEELGEASHVGDVLRLSLDTAARPGDELAHRSGEQQVAVADDRQRVAGRLDLAEEVRGDDDGTALVAETPQKRADLDDPRRVETIGGLVEHEEFRVGEQRGGDPQPLLHAQGEALRRLLAAVQQTDGLEHFLHATVGIPRSRASERRLVRAESVGTNAGPSTSAPTRAA